MLSEKAHWSKGGYACAYDSFKGLLSANLLLNTQVLAVHFPARNERVDTAER